MDNRSLFGVSKETPFSERPWPTAFRLTGWTQAPSACTLSHHIFLGRCPLRVVLLHVRDPQFYAFLAEKKSNRGYHQIIGFPPIGIMSLSSVLKRAGHECFMFDQANPDTPDDHIMDELATLKPDLVGLSFLSTTTYPYAKILARRIRSQFPEIRMAMGGVFATLNAHRVKGQCTEVDYVCRGDGEQVILDLLDNLDQPANVDGITWAEEDGTVRTNPPRPIERDLDQWPYPDRESLKLDFIESMPLDVPAVVSMDRYTTIQTSRGCPFPCIFCDIPAFNNSKWRSRSPEHVVGELKVLQEQGYGGVYFVDDHFLLKPKRIEAICEGLVEQGNKVRWGCEGRVDSDPCLKMLPKMVESGCRSLMFGCESGSQKILDRLKKKQTLEQVESAVKLAKKAGVEIVHGFFVIGCPDEQEEDVRKTFRFASKLPLDSFGFNRLCVYRGTPLWNEYVDRKLVDDEKDWYKFFKCTTIDPTILSGEIIHRVRREEFKRLIIYKFTHYPIATFKLLRHFLRTMSFMDVFRLVASPFLGKTKGATRAEVLSRAVEHQDMKTAAADLTLIADEDLAEAIQGSRVLETE